MRLSECPVRPAIDVVEGKWKPIVVNALKAGRLRFGQLRRHVPEASRKVLTEQMGQKTQKNHAKKNGKESRLEEIIRERPVAGGRIRFYFRCRERVLRSRME